MSSRLILTLPVGNLTATSLDVAGLAYHQRPGSGKHFLGRTVLAELLPLDQFSFLPEGGWRDAHADAEAALREVEGGKKTKTALSCGAFFCTPLAAIQKLWLGKTGGEVLGLEGPDRLASYDWHDCHEHLTPTEVAAAIGQPAPPLRSPRLYLVLAPVEFLVLSSLTPTEYAWYSTHRPGKKFRQVMFTEVDADPSSMVSLGKYEHAREELTANPDKKTKTLVTGDIYDKLSFDSWLGIDGRRAGGLYVADADNAWLWRFPQPVPHLWDRAP